MNISRLWGIRHVRWLYYTWRVHQFAWQCGLMGLGMGTPNPSDLRHLDRIKNGEA